MSAILDLMQLVEEAASVRNHEIVVAILLRDDLDLCCCYGKTWWHIKSLNHKINKLNHKIDKLHRRIGGIGGIGGRYVDCNNHRGGDLTELQLRKADLTEQVEKDRLLLNNLMRCGICPACKWTPPAVGVIDPDTFQLIVTGRTTPIDDFNFIAEGGEGD